MEFQATAAQKEAKRYILEVVFRSDKGLLKIDTVEFLNLLNIRSPVENEFFNKVIEDWVQDIHPDNVVDKIYNALFNLCTLCSSLILDIEKRSVEIKELHEKILLSPILIEQLSRRKINGENLFLKIFNDSEKSHTLKVEPEVEVAVWKKWSRVCVSDELEEDSQLKMFSKVYSALSEDNKVDVNLYLRDTK